jgi:hypothetical protein
MDSELLGLVDRVPKDFFVQNGKQVAYLQLLGSVITMLADRLGEPR